MHIQVYMQKSENALVVIQVKHTTSAPSGGDDHQCKSGICTSWWKENTTSAVYTVVDQEQDAATKCK